MNVRVPVRVPVRLQPRDLDMLSDLGRSRALSLDQIARRYFASPSVADPAKRASDRLSKLFRSGLIERASYLTPGGDGSDTAHRAFCLRPAGLAALRRRGLAPPHATARRYRMHVAEGRLRHEITINEIEHSQGVRFQRDHLGDGRDGHPGPQADARIETEPDERGRTAVLLELDLGQYSARRIAEKVSALAPVAKRLVFAAPTPDRAAWLAEQAHRTSPYYAERCEFVVIDDLLSGAARLR